MRSPDPFYFLFSHYILGFQSRWCFILFLECDLTDYFICEMWWAHLRIWSPQPGFRYVHKILQRHIDMAPLWELTSCWSSTHEFGDHSWVVKYWYVIKSTSIKLEGKKNPRFFLLHNQVERQICSFNPWFIHGSIFIFKKLEVTMLIPSKHKFTIGVDQGEPSEISVLVLSKRRCQWI